MEYDMSIHTNPDASAWVKFFRECNPGCNVPDDMMLGWFSNAMMAMHDYLKGGSIQNGDHAQHLIDTARRGVLEEAATYVESIAACLDHPSVYMGGPSRKAKRDAKYVADAIRALKEK